MFIYLAGVANGWEYLQWWGTWHAVVWTGARCVISFPCTYLQLLSMYSFELCDLYCLIKQKCMNFLAYFFIAPAICCDSVSSVPVSRRLILVFGKRVTRRERYTELKIKYYIRSWNEHSFLLWFKVAVMRGKSDLSSRTCILIDSVSN